MMRRFLSTRLIFGKLNCEFEALINWNEVQTKSMCSHCIIVKEVRGDECQNYFESHLIIKNLEGQ